MTTMTETDYEIWESTTGGTTWVQVKDPRVPGGWRQQKVGGKGTQRLQITPEERAFNQELVPYENAHHDPFKNGLLVRTHPKQAERGEFELADEQLVEMLAINSDEVFEEQLKTITSEVIVRRLLELSSKHATMARHGAIQDVVDDRYRIGKMSKVVKELYEDDAKYADADV
jgi:hypothetical protein